MDDLKLHINEHFQALFCTHANNTYMHWDTWVHNGFDEGTNNTLASVPLDEEILSAVKILNLLSFGMEIPSLHSGEGP